jgi:hypothetical protein
MNQKTCTTWNSKKKWVETEQFCPDSQNVTSGYLLHGTVLKNLLRARGICLCAVSTVHFHDADTDDAYATIFPPARKRSIVDRAEELHQPRIFSSRWCSRAGCFLFRYAEKNETFYKRTLHYWSSKKIQVQIQISTLKIEQPNNLSRSSVA